MSAGRPTDADIDALLAAVQRGEADPAVLYGRLYDELHRLAEIHRGKWVGNLTLNATALVHEAYLKVAGADSFESRRHFMGVASQAMRQVLVDYARRQSAAKRGGTGAAVPLDDAGLAALLSPQQADEVVQIDQALQTLARLDARAASVVEMRFFGGLGLAEIGQALGVSEATVKRDWRRARAWLRAEAEGLGAS